MITTASLDYEAKIPKAAHNGCTHSYFKHGSESAQSGISCQGASFIKMLWRNVLHLSWVHFLKVHTCDSEKRTYTQKRHDVSLFDDVRILYLRMLSGKNCLDFLLTAVLWHLHKTWRGTKHFSTSVGIWKLQIWMLEWILAYVQSKIKSVHKHVL